MPYRDALAGVGAQGDVGKAGWMAFLTSYSWRKSALLLIVSAILVGLAFAVRYGEDNQVGSSNEVSWWVFVAAGVFAYWGVLGLAVSAFRGAHSRGRRQATCRNACEMQPRRS